MNEHAMEGVGENKWKFIKTTILNRLWWNSSLGNKYSVIYTRKYGSISFSIRRYDVSNLPLSQRERVLEVGYLPMKRV